MTNEYLTVELPHGKNTQHPQDWTVHLNAVAQQGWRLVAISASGLHNLQHLATFERSVGGPPA